MRENQTIAVTGCTGFVGSALERRLTADGLRVRALVRRESLQRFEPGPSTETVVGDLADEDALAQLVTGVAAVVHCAARVRGLARDFEAANVEGTRRLVRTAARESPAARFVHISSLAAREPQLSAYATSKRDSERALAEEAADLRWVALRPPAIYGPEDRELLPLLRWVARGLAPVLAPREARFSLLFVEDLADCIADLLHAGPSEGSFEVHDGHAPGYSWRDVVQAVSRVSGRRALRVRVPAPLVRGLAALNLGAARLLGSAPMLTPGKVRELLHRDWVCDDTPLQKALSWRPRVSLFEGLERTLLPGAGRPA